MMHRLRIVAAGLLLACTIGTAAAAEFDSSDTLRGRLLRIKSTGVVRVGYRENAIPFSYTSGGQPVGYSLDLCAAIVAAIAEEVEAADLRIDYVRVTPIDRIDKVASGAVDLECGSTTNTAERRARVAFSPVIFITGTRLAVMRESGIRGALELRGRSVAVIRGTTNEAAMRELDRLQSLAIRFVTTPDYRDALDRLAAGDVQAIAADDVLLRGVLAETGKSGSVLLVGEMLSLEPYGIMYPRDDEALGSIVDRTLRSLAASREIVWIYNRWFIRPLPSGQRIGLPLGPELRRSFELLGLPPD